MNKPKIKTLGELKSSDYTYKSLNQEITDNLRHNLSKGVNVFSSLIGYEAVSYTHLTLPTKA